MTIAPWVRVHLRDVGLMVLTLFACQGVLGYLNRGLALRDLALLATCLVVVSTLLAWIRARRTQRADAGV